MPLLHANDLSITDLALIWYGIAVISNPNFLILFIAFKRCLVEVHEEDKTFNFEQFAMAKFLVEMKLEGEELPSELPSSLQQSLRDGESKDKIFASSNQANQNVKLSPKLRAHTFSGGASNVSERLFLLFSTCTTFISHPRMW